MKSCVRKRIGLVLATAVFLGLTGTCALAVSNPNNTILNGTYQAVDQRAGFSTGAAGWVNAQLSGDNGTLTFNGDGICSGTMGGNSYSLPIGIPDPTVSTYANPAAYFDCTYDVADDGTVSLIHPEGTETFYTTPDGTMIIDGGADQNTNDQGGTDYDIDQFTMVKVVDNPTLKGTFRAVNQDAGFYGSSAGLYGGGGTLTFNGIGGCTFTFANSSYELGANGTVTPSPDGGSGTCTYVTGADGKVTVTIGAKETEEFFLSSDGNVILQGGTKDSSGDGWTGHEVRQMVAIKVGSTMTNASLQGTFRMVSQEAGFWSSAPAGGASIHMWGDSGILTFNGAGVCSYAFEGLNLSVPLAQNPTIDSSFDSPVGSCTYTVAANGAVTLTHSEGTEKFWLSANGSTLIGGGAKKTVEANGSDYKVAQSVAIKTNKYVGVNEAPVTLTVPLNDPDGNYTVSWDEVEAGLTYVLQESKDPTFATGVRTAYRGKNLSFNITLRPKGQSYYYQVRSEKTGYEPSAWTIAPDPCNVGTPLLPASITVPATDADGGYTITWKASLTPGVTYTVEEATDSLFLNIVATYIGSETTWGRDNTTGTTYFYRVKVEKLGFSPAESVWKKALNPCKVGLLPPTAFTVPPSAGTSYEISWAASLTAGVTYVLQEATDKAFTLGLRTVTLPAPDATSVTISARRATKTYYYRVRAVKLNYTSTPWLKGANGCLVVADAPK